MESYRFSWKKKSAPSKHIWCNSILSKKAKNIFLFHFAIKGKAWQIRKILKANVFSRVWDEWMIRRETGEALGCLLDLNGGLHGCLLGLYGEAILPSCCPCCPPCSSPLLDKEYPAWMNALTECPHHIHIKISVMEANRVVSQNEGKIRNINIGGGGGGEGGRYIVAPWVNNMISERQGTTMCLEIWCSLPLKWFSCQETTSSVPFPCFSKSISLFFKSISLFFQKYFSFLEKYFRKG